jgi:hypothetical protein
MAHVQKLGEAARSRKKGRAAIETSRRIIMPTDGKISRRTWLRKVALLTAAAGVPSPLASAKPTEEKASKSAVHYQDRPKNMQMCGMCKFFEGHGGMGHGMMCGGMIGGGMMGGGMGHGMMLGECEVVQGRISAMGWCGLYAPRRA